MFKKGPPAPLAIDAPNPNWRRPDARPFNTHKKHFEQTQSCLWMLPPLQHEQLSRCSPPPAMPPRHGSPAIDMFRQISSDTSASPPFAVKPSASPSSGIGFVLPSKPSPTQKFEAAHQVMIAGLGRFSAMTRELNLTMHMPFRVSCPMAQALSRCLPSFVRLQVLQLGSNEIADSGASAIVRACAAHDTLKQLYLHCNRLTSRSADAIGSALQLDSCGLQLLQLGGNKMGDAGARRIAHALQEQTSLVTLDMSQNSVTDDGMDALAAALRRNDSLQELGMNGNAITDKGLGALLTALGFNTALISVDLGETLCSERALDLLAELIVVKTNC